MKMGDQVRFGDSTWVISGRRLLDGRIPVSGPGPCRSLKYVLPSKLTVIRTREELEERRAAHRAARRGET